ncbi:hypothetical protein [Micromonospora sp. NPDC005172]
MPARLTTIARRSDGLTDPCPVLGIGRVLRRAVDVTGVGRPEASDFEAEL